ncbi:MAG: peroxiredoxin [Verrucomicrobia bacterium]|nr:MAG: peroxiredoxin [Verrucomicrobiota bacterium]
MSIEVNTKAPDFTLRTKTADGLKDIKLSDNFGKKQTVLLFFPMAFTGVCTKELCTATEDYQDYANLDATVYGISHDSPFAQDAWSKASKMSITLLSDMDSKVIDAYGVQAADKFGFPGIAMRSVFVINKDGVVTYKWVGNELSDFPDFNAVKEVLKKSASKS